MLAFITAILTSIIMILIGLVNATDEDVHPKKWTPLLQVVFALLLIVCIVRLSNGVCRDNTYKKALIENPYKMKVLYDVRQDSIIPYDTIFIEK